MGVPELCENGCVIEDLITKQEQINAYHAKLLEARRYLPDPLPRASRRLRFKFWRRELSRRTRERLALWIAPELDDY